jgi:hypothetical protein
MRFEVLTASSMKMRVFWYIRRQYTRLKCHSAPARLHGPISKKALIFKDEDVFQSIVSSFLSLYIPSPF